MNQIQFETSKVFGVFVKIDDFKEMKRAGMNSSGNFRIQYETINSTVSTFTVDGIDENYKIVGFVSELTDEQKEGVVEQNDSPFSGGTYKNYDPSTIGFHATASESFASLLTSLNVLLVNPHKFPSTIDHEFYDEPYDGTGFYQELYSGAMEQWQTAQQHVGNWILLTSEK